MCCLFCVAVSDDRPTQVGQTVVSTDNVGASDLDALTWNNQPSAVILGG